MCDKLWIYIHTLKKIKRSKICQDFPHNICFGLEWNIRIWKDLKYVVGQLVVWRVYRRETRNFKEPHLIIVRKENEVVKRVRPLEWSFTVKWSLNRKKGYILLAKKSFSGKIRARAFKTRIYILVKVKKCRVAKLSNTSL